VRKRRILLSLLVLAAAWGINTVPGCGAMPDAWGEYPTKQPLPAVVVRLTAAEVTATCGPRTMGCVKRDYANGICLVYLEARPLPETFAHEALHCAGFEHGL
jgi:hypothetical protein